MNFGCLIIRLLFLFLVSLETVDIYSVSAKTQKSSRKNRSVNVSESKQNKKIENKKKTKKAVEPVVVASENSSVQESQKADNINTSDTDEASDDDSDCTVSPGDEDLLDILPELEEVIDHIPLDTVDLSSFSLLENSLDSDADISSDEEEITEDLNSSDSDFDSETRSESENITESDTKN